MRSSPRTAWPNALEPGRTPQITRVLVPGYVLQTALWQDPQWSGPEHALMPNDVAVLIYTKHD